MIAGQTLAQATCSALVEAAATTLADTCTDLTPGIVCYGSQAVETAFVAGSEPDTDTTVTNLDSLQRITTFGADPDAGTWGVAALSIQDVGGGELVGLLTGDATLTRPVDGDPVLAAFTEFTLQTATEPGPCTEAPSLLALYTDADTTASLQINGQPVRMTGVVTLQWQSPNSMTATVHSGELTIVNGEAVPEGSTVSAVMDNNGVVQFWSASRAAIETELAVVVPVGQLLSALGYPFEAAPVAAPVTAQTADCGTSVTHTVASGDTLFNISQRYGTTVDALVVANDIPDRNAIFAGQQLTVPCPNQVDTSVLAETPADPAPVGSTDFGQAAAEIPCDVPFPAVPDFSEQLGTAPGTVVVPEFVVPCSP